MTIFLELCSNACQAHLRARALRFLIRCLPMVGVSLGAGSLISQRPARVSVGAMYDRVVGSSLYGVAAQASVLSLGHLGNSHMSLGGRAFAATGVEPGSQGSTSTQWDISPLVFLTLGTGPSPTRIHLFVGLGYAHFKRELDTGISGQDHTDKQESAGIASQSGLTLERDITKRWGINVTVALHNQPIGSRQRTSAQLVLGAHIR